MISSVAERPIVAQPAVYLTDGTDLFYVVDVCEGESLLLENALDGELTWHAIEELPAKPELRIVSVAD